MQTVGYSVCLLHKATLILNVSLLRGSFLWLTQLVSIPTFTMYYYKHVAGVTISGTFSNCQMNIIYTNL